MVRDSTTTLVGARDLRNSSIGVILVLREASKHVLHASIYGFSPWIVDY